MLLDSCGIDAAVTARDGRVLFLNGDLDRYLTLPRGEMRPDLFAMLAGWLRTRVRAGFHRAVRKGKAVTVTCRDETGRTPREVRVPSASGSARPNSPGAEATAS